MTVRLDGSDFLAEALKEVTEQDAHVILERGGEPIAAVVSLRDLKLLEEYIEALEDAVDRIELARAKEEGGDPIPFEDFCKELGV